MGDIIVRQNLGVLVAKAPAQAGNPITERDFAVDPQEQVELTTYGEDAGARFIVPASGSLTVGLDSLTLAKALWLRFDSDCGVVITNGAGVSQQLTFKGGVTSAIHFEFTALQFVNGTASPIKGRFGAAGD